MHPQLRNALEVIAFIVVVTLICLAIPVQAHEVDCTDADFMRCVSDAVKASPMGAP